MCRKKEKRKKEEQSCMLLCACRAQLSQNYEQHEQLTLRAQSLEDAQALMAQELKTQRTFSSVLPCLEEGSEHDGPISCSKVECVLLSALISPISHDAMSVVLHTLPCLLSCHS